MYYLVQVLTIEGPGDKCQETSEEERSPYQSKGRAIDELKGIDIQEAL
jgi:hypothetical protein